ncbi:MAG: hypothetical protein DRI61_15680, partial [Chloroflexi bacterium]
MNYDGEIEIVDSSYNNEVVEITAGETLYIKITDYDLSIDNSKEKVIVSITTTSNDTETIILTETSGNSGIFTGEILTRTGTLVAGNNKLDISGTDVIEVRYKDTEVVELSTGWRSDTCDVREGVTGVVEFISELITGTGVDSYVINRELYIRVTDNDMNITSGVETVKVTIEVTSGDSEVITLTETSGSSGIFEGSIGTILGDKEYSNGTIEILGSDYVTVRYIDDIDGNGYRNQERYDTGEMEEEGEIKIVEDGSGSGNELTGIIIGDT